MNFLENIVKNVVRLNDCCDGKVVSKDQIKDALGDQEDFKNLMEKINNDVSALSSLNKAREDEVIEKLIYIHIELQSVVWHVEQVHELVVEAIKRYRKALGNKEK